MPLCGTCLRLRVWKHPVRFPTRLQLRQPHANLGLRLLQSYNTALLVDRQDDSESPIANSTLQAFHNAKHTSNRRLRDLRRNEKRGGGGGGGVYLRKAAITDQISVTFARRSIGMAHGRFRRLSRTRRLSPRLQVTLLQRRRKLLDTDQVRFIPRRPTSRRLATSKIRPASFNYSTPRVNLTVSTQTWSRLKWQKKISKMKRRFRYEYEERWPRSTWVPVIDIRASDWTEAVLARLHSSQQYLEINDMLSNHKDPSHVWNEVAIWLLTYDPRSMPAFLLATHYPPIPMAYQVQDSLSYLERYWSGSNEADRILQLERVANAFCVLADRGTGEALNFFNPFFRMLIKCCSDEQIVNMFRAVKTHNVQTHWNTYLHFTTYFANNNHFEEAFEALMAAKDAGADLNSWQFRSNCATLLRRSSEQPDGLRVCLRIVSELVDIGVILNNPICNIIMLNAVEAGDLKTAFSIYHSLVDRGLQPTESTFAVLLKGCKMNIDDVETLNDTIRTAIAHVAVRKSEMCASEILHCLALHHSKHNPNTALHTLTEAYAQLFDLRPLQRLGLPIPKIPQDHQNFMPPTQPALNFLIGATVDQHLDRGTPYAEGIVLIYDRWRAQVEAGERSLAALATTDYTANIFLKAFIRRPSGLIHATKVMRDMQRDLPPSAGVQQIRPTVQSWSIFLHGFMRHGKTKLAEQVLNYMRSQGVEPDHVTWNTLLTGYARAQDDEGTVDALRRAEQGGLVWDRWTHGGLRLLRNQQGLMEELHRDRLRQQLDFTSELRDGLGARLSEMRETAEVDVVNPESSTAARDGFADSAGDIAEQSSYRPF